MRDTELVLELLRQIEDAAEKIGTRFQPIRQVSDFTDSQTGVEKMDAICREKIPQFLATIRKIINDLDSGKTSG